MKSDYPLRVLVCGGRDYDDSQHVWETLAQINIAAIAHGGAPGADKHADYFCSQHGLPVYAYYADWKRYGKLAGPIRNKQMLDDFGPDLVVAFPGGRGTAHMVGIARAAGVEVLVASATQERKAGPVAASRVYGTFVDLLRQPSNGDTND